MQQLKLSLFADVKIFYIENSKEPKDILFKLIEKFTTFIGILKNQYTTAFLKTSNV